MITLYRDDDVSKFTDISLFMKVHSLFGKYQKLHTVAVEMEDLWENKVIWYILVTQKNIKVDLHGWKHKDYSILSYQEIVDDIRRSLDYWYMNIERGYGIDAIGKDKKITTFFPPWNRVSDNLKKACIDTGLTLDSRIGGDVYNFHWWACVDDCYLDSLEQMLKV
jgi:hypothetical protein